MSKRKLETQDSAKIRELEEKIKRIEKEKEKAEEERKKAEEERKKAEEERKKAETKSFITEGAFRQSYYLGLQNLNSQISSREHIQTVFNTEWPKQTLNEIETARLQEVWANCKEEFEYSLMMIENPPKEIQTTKAVNIIMKHLVYLLDFALWTEEDDGYSMDITARPDFGIFKKAEKPLTLQRNSFNTILVAGEVKNTFSGKGFGSARTAAVRYFASKMLESGLETIIPLTTIISDGLGWSFVTVTSTETRTTNGLLQLATVANVGKIIIADDLEKKIPDFFLELYYLLVTKLKAAAEVTDKSNHNSENFFLIPDGKVEKKFIIKKIVFAKPYCYVYHVKNEGKDFGLKLISQPSEQLQNETNYLKKLNHQGKCPSIPQLIYSGIEITTGWSVLITDAIGTALSNLILPLDTQVLIQLVSDLSHALKHIHNANMIYCDLHPGNVLLKEDGKFVLIDFGSVLYKRGTRKFLGTPCFASIGYLAKATPSPLFDFESLIYLCVYLQTGTLPWWKDDEILTISQKKLQLLSKLCSECPSFLKDLPVEISRIKEAASKVKLKDGIVCHLGILIEDEVKKTRRKKKISNRKVPLIL